jgi:hypothetical protein
VRRRIAGCPRSHGNDAAATTAWRCRGYPKRPSTRAYSCSPFGICAATTFVFALVPAIAVWKANVYETLKDGGGSASSGVRSVHVRGALVAIEVALTVVLLFAAGLMVKSFWHMTAYPPGFAPDRVLTMLGTVFRTGYRDPQSQRAFVDELLRRTAAAPAVEAAALVRTVARSCF